VFGVEEEEEIEGFAPPRGRPDVTYAPDLEELVDRVERPQRRWLERAILLSLLVHACLVIFFLLDRARQRAIEVRDVERAIALRKEELARQVPIRFYAESPGPARPTARRDAPLSDKNRRASGGDPNRPPAPTPYVARQNGMEGLAPGSRSKPESSSPPVPRGNGAPSPSSAPPASPAPPKPEALAPPRATPAPIDGRGQGSPNLSLNEAIRKATGGTGGQGGAPKANEAGGFVDYGPISFDTQWYDWGDYAEEMLRKIKIHWYENIPKLAELGPDGKLTIRFYIRADGSVEGENVVKSSEIPPYDHAAFLGISQASPFRPLPKELKEDREGVTITFLYLHYHQGQKTPAEPR